MITIRQARIVVLEQAPRGLDLGGESVAVTEASGRVLRRGVRSDTDLPPFDRVTMDGYAVRSVDAVPGAVLPILREVAAGDAGDDPLSDGEAVSIMTGAPLPPGADAVVQVEWTVREGDRVRIERGVRPGQNVAPAGQDLRAGDEVLAAGTRLDALSLSAVIAAGAGRVDVVRRPRVALVTSGNELVPPGERLRRGRIRESNGPALAALFTAMGARVDDLGVARDEREDLDARLERAMTADVVVLTGGSSVGRYDFSQAAVESLGARRHFDRVSVKPGKPTLLHTREGTLVFCLPGNPVAALMTGRVLVGAAIGRLCGLDVSPWTDEEHPLATPVARNAARDLLVPMRRVPEGLAFDGWHGSGDVLCMARADGFGFVERGEGEARAGARVPFFATRDPWAAP